MRHLTLLLMLTLLWGCTKPTPDTPPPSEIPTRAVFVYNEGNFMYGNASLSVYDPDGRTVENQMFYHVNDFPLGDVFQSMRIIGSHGYMVVNNSGKVVVVDPATCRYVGTIKGLISPRYIEPVDESKIYISDLYSPSIAIADPRTLEVTGSVHVGRSTEQMVSRGDFVYVCSWSFSNKVYKIDTRSDLVVDSLEVTSQPNSMVMDREGQIWVLSDGGYVGSPHGTQMAALTRIDTESFTVEQRMEFADIAHSPTELTLCPTADTLYYLGHEGVFRMPIGQAQLPSRPFIAQGPRLFYGLGVDPRTSEVYVSDAVDYVQQGVVLRYTVSGELLDSFRVDIIPSGFCFR